MDNLHNFDMFTTKRKKLLERKALALFIKENSSINLGNTPNGLNSTDSVCLFSTREHKNKHSINESKEGIIHAVEGQLINKYENKIRKIHKRFTKGDATKIFRSLEMRSLKNSIGNQQTGIKIEKQSIVFRDSSLMDLINNSVKPNDKLKLALIRNKCSFCKQLFGINFKEHIFLTHENPTATIRQFHEIKSIIHIHFDKTIFKFKVKNSTKILDIKKYIGKFLNKSVRQIHLKTSNKILTNKEMIGEVIENEFLLFFKTQA